jgi:LacI family transcriptional regulator
MVKLSPRKRVLLALGWHSYRLHRGVARYADEARWILNIEMERTGQLPNYWEGDGAICVLGMDDKQDKKILALKIPTVSIGPVIAPGVPRVFPDNELIGQQAAEHFLTRGFKHFAYYICSGGPSEEIRAAEFKNALKKHDVSIHPLDWASKPDAMHSNSRARIEWLVESLKKLPKPLAVATEFDDRGAEVLQACENAGVHVPEEVAVLGADNDDLICEFTPVPLSSVDTDVERQGYEAAALLDRMMNGAKAPKRATLIPPIGVVIRKSSDMLGVQHPHVATALNRIWNHYQEPVTTEQLCKGIPMSYRRLHDAFVKHIGRTMAEELRRCRIEHAQRLLVEPEMYVMEDIAERAGFSSAGQMARVFSHFVGVSPSQYRKDHTYENKT